MRNILENKFWWTARFFAAVALFSVSTLSANIFITEIADPNGDEALRFVELHNNGSADIDLAAEGYKIQRWTNGNADPTASSIKDLTGTISAGGFYILVPGDGSAFQAAYGFAADQVIGNGGAADSNGDDQIAIINASGDIVDIFGVPGEDGTGTAHEFEDGRAERVATVTSGSATWVATEWNIDNDAGAGDGAITAPGGYDPGAWIGTTTQPTGTDVMFTVTDETESYTNIKYKGTATSWANVQMHDDGTSGDATAGDHVWTVVLNVEAGDHEWGAVEDDGSTDGLWLITGSNLTYSVATTGIVTGQTDYTIEASEVTAMVTFKVVDHTHELTDVRFKGTMSMWALFQGYDDGTNGDEVAGDHVWTAQYETAAGTHEWGAIDTDNGDGTVCSACDGTDGYGTWLLGAYSNQALTIQADGNIVGSTSFDVGTPPAPIVGMWKLAPIPGALKVGQNVDDGGWWQNDAGHLESRACLFDDEYVFHADGTFENILGTETFLEPWQGNDPEGCGAPVAPHDGSTAGTWSIDETANTLTITGVGSYMGLAKAYNGGELGSPADAPESITYSFVETIDGVMALTIQSAGGGSGYWTFRFTRDGVLPDFESDVTFAVDMSEVETHPEGVYIAGGVFGQDGILMDDSDGDDVWHATVSLAKGATVNYKFRNQPSFGTWDGFEDASGLVEGGCNYGDYNDRFLIVPNEDAVLETVCYSSCYSCGYTPPEPETVHVLFRVDMNGEGSISEDGVFIAGGGSFGGPGDYLMEDHNNDGVYERGFDLTPGVDYAYTFLNGNCGDWGCKENIEGQSCAVGQYNDRLINVSNDTIATHRFADCSFEYSDSVWVEFTLDMANVESVHETGVFLAGGAFGGPWDANYVFTQIEGTTLWYLADSLPANWGSDYTFTNGDWGWDAKENIVGQDCAVEPYSDRHLETTVADQSITACFGLCGDGTCDQLSAPDTAFVHFRLDMTGEEVHESGVYLAGGGFGYPGDYRMEDPDSNGVYEIGVDLIAGGTYTYTFTNGNWGWDAKEQIAGQSCAVEPYSDRQITVTGDMLVDQYFGQCDYTWDSVYVEIALDMSNAGEVHETGVFLAGGNFGYPGDYPFVQDDYEPNMWYFADSMPANWGSDYTFTNGNWGWDAKESIGGQSCAVDPYNDRHLMTGIGDLSISACFALCGDGSCSQIQDTFIEVDFELIADSNPCDGNPYVTGTFDGWSGYGVELMLDEDGEAYYGSIDLAPGVYDYKFVCGGWSSQEDVPAACGVDNGQGGFNRQVDVSYDNTECDYDGYTYQEECWIETDPVAWGQCPPPDFCDIFDCDNKLHAIVLVDTSQYDFGTMEVRMTGPWWNWDPNAGPVATWQEFWDPRDAQDLGVGGFFHVQFDPIPTEEMQYLWVINGETELGELLASDDLSCVTYTDYYSYATRAWQPEDCDPLDNECIFADMYGGCWMDDEEPEEPEEFVGSVVACDPWHYENGYGGNFFGVDPWVADLINSGDILTITQGDQSHSFTVQNLSTTSIESCVDEYGDPVNFYVFIDGSLVDTFGEDLMVGSTFINESLVSGCTDPMAFNYNPDALWDDGSCDYDYTEPEYSHNVSFDNLSDMVKDRNYNAHTSDGTYLYALGGWSMVYEVDESTGMIDTNYVRLGSAERYDPVMNTWEIITEDLIPRTRGDAVYHMGSIYIFGGKIDDPDLGPPYDSWTRTVEILNLETGEIIQLVDSMPLEVDFAGHAIWNDKIYIWAGDQAGLENDFGGLSTQMHSFDISTGEWVQLSDYPENVETVEGVAVDGHIYSFGGYKGDGSSSKMIHAYDIELDEWNTIAEMPNMVSTHRAVYDNYQNKILVVGDYNNLEYVGVYDLNNGEFNDAHTENMLPRRRFSTEFMNGKLFTFGGQSPDGSIFRNLQRGHIDYNIDQEQPELTLTNYTLYEVQTLDSYMNGASATVTLPEVDVNDGVHVRAVLDTIGLEGPYAAAAVLYYDANFSGVLDEGDFNVLQWGQDGDADDVIIIADNGPDDMNPDEGVYEVIIYADTEEGGFLTTQGATYFMAAVGLDGAVVDHATVHPVSGSTNRVTGAATLVGAETTDPIGVSGMFVTIWDWYTGDQIGAGVTVPDGSYNIGVDVTEYTTAWMSVGEAYEITDRYLGIFEDGGWSGYGGTWKAVTLGMDGTVQDFDVIELNTMVHGQVTDHDGNPISGAYVDVSWDLSGYYSDQIQSSYQADDSGHYQFWGLNGTPVTISAYDSIYSYEDYYDDVYIFSEVYDDYLGAYVFNYNIMLTPRGQLPPTDLIENNGFEDWYQNDGWQRFAHDWDYHPSNWNHHIEGTGAGIFGSSTGATFTALEGEHSLKMWGAGSDDGDNYTDYFQSLYDYVAPGAVINASAMMMSHADDWIGKTGTDGEFSGMNSGQVFVAYFDTYGTFLQVDLSPPMDATFAASEWHHMHVESVVPYGASQINMGVRFNHIYHPETNVQGVGAIYYDHVEAHVNANEVQTVEIYGTAMYDPMDEFGNINDEPLPYAPIQVWNDNYYIEVMADEYGNWSAEVPVFQEYYVSGGDLEGFYDSSFEMIFACDPYYYYYDYYYDYYSYYYDYYECNNSVDVHFNSTTSMWFDVHGQVTDNNGNPMPDVWVNFSPAGGMGDSYGAVTDYMGYYHVGVRYGVYHARASLPGFMTSHVHDIEVQSQGVYIDFTLVPAVLTGAVEGLITFNGNPPDGPASIWVGSPDYMSGGEANENGFFNIPLPDGVYDIWIGAPNYEGFYGEQAFEVSGNTVVFNVDLFEVGFAAAPHIVDLHDVPNDQGRQMRSVWDAGIPGNWGYFTQFSIWRKVNGAPIELWDYVETVPWHGMDDPYAAVVPTLGDSSAHGIHESTFMVTAHTEDVDIWFDSQPVSGYSIDNLHPGAPMSLMYSQDPGMVSLSWSGPQDEDFSYHNIYRQEIASTEPAVVFTTVDSFYVDLEVEDLGAYQYWVTAVDLSGLESDPSNSVSAVLSADEEIGLPTEFALNQNYPNPFNPSTQIQYALPEETRVVISIYDLMGRKVRTLVNDVQDAGYRSVMWNATNDMGRLVSAGVYIYSIQAGDFVQNRKMVLMK